MITIRIDPMVYTARPAAKDRPAKELKVYDLLECLGIPFVRLDHEETATIEACIEVEKILGIEICKNLFLCNAQKTSFYLLMMPGDKNFRTKDLSRQINSSRLSFADAENMERLLDITPGSVSILGLMNDEGHRVKLLIDEDLLAHEYVGCHPCVNTCSLKIKLSDLLGKFLPHTGHAPTIVKL